MYNPICHTLFPDWGYFLQQNKQTQTELEEYRDYFKNLDVQTEVNNKIDDLIAKGEFVNLFDSLIPSYISMADVPADVGYLDVFYIYDRQMLFKVTEEQTPLQLAPGKYLQTCTTNGYPAAYGANQTSHDADIIQYCLDHYDITDLQGRNYQIEHTINIPYGKSLIGHGANLYCDLQTGDHVLYVNARPPIWQAERAGLVKEVSGFICINTGKPDSVGMVLGNWEGTPSVNYSVYGYGFNSLAFSDFSIGIHLRTAWSCAFNRVKVFPFTKTGLLIEGQNVNNKFTDCEFNGQGKGEAAVKIITHGGLRAEGPVFTNCFIGNTNIGLDVPSVLTAEFANCYFDLNARSAVNITGAGINFVNCYMSSNSGAYPTVYLWGATSPQNDISTRMTNCYIINLERKQAIAQYANNNNLVCTGCEIHGTADTMQQGAYMVLLGCSFHGERYSLNDKDQKQLIGCFYSNGRGAIT